MSQNTMRYKGYVGSIQYSAEDGCFIGDVLGIRDMISFEGESVSELRTDFENAVNHYLASCRERGKEPAKPRGGQLTLTLPFELEVCLEQTAEETGKSTKALVLDALKTAYLPDDRHGPIKRHRAIPKTISGQKSVM